MGMFDTVIIEGLKLPKLSKEVNDFLKENSVSLPNDFQTKDLDSALSTYTINSDGQIFLTEYIPTGKKIKYESPFKGWVDNRSLLERLYFNLKNRSIEKRYPTLRLVDERKPKKVKTNITNTFEIYTNSEINGRYVEASFNIEAIKGRVNKIKLNQCSLEPLKEANLRKAEDKIFKEKLALTFEKNKEFKARWYYPVLKELYNPLVFFASKSIQAVCNYIVKQTHRWHGV